MAVRIIDASQFFESVQPTRAHVAVTKLCQQVIDRTNCTSMLVPRNKKEPARPYAKGSKRLPGDKIVKLNDLVRATKGICSINVAKFGKNLIARCRGVLIGGIASRALCCAHSAVEESEIHETVSNEIYATRMVDDAIIASATVCGDCVLREVAAAHSTPFNLEGCIVNDGSVTWCTTTCKLTDKPDEIFVDAKNNPDYMFKHFRDGGTSTVPKKLQDPSYNKSFLNATIAGVLARDSWSPPACRVSLYGMALQGFHPRTIVHKVNALRHSQSQRVRSAAVIMFNYLKNHPIDDLTEHLQSSE